MRPSLVTVLCCLDSSSKPKYIRVRAQVMSKRLDGFPQGQQAPVVGTGPRTAPPPAPSSCPHARYYLKGEHCPNAWCHGLVVPGFDMDKMDSKGKKVKL